MSEQPPSEQPPPNPPDTPPTPPPPAPPVPQPVPIAPESGASEEVLTAIKGLTEVVTNLVNKQAGIPDDHTPVKRPWTQWGSKR